MRRTCWPTDPLPAPLASRLTAQPLRDLYELVPRDDVPGGFSALIVETPSPSWSLGLGVLTNSSVAITFNTGVALSGSLDAACGTISWNNTSQWVVVPPITQVHLVFMNHLDIGYNGIYPTTGFIANVLNRYFTVRAPAACSQQPSRWHPRSPAARRSPRCAAQVYFPQAIALAQALRLLGGVERFIYTTHPILLSLYLDCPANFTLARGLTLQCPDADAQAAMEAAMVRGDITWHAGPMNQQFENAGDPRLVQLSLLLAKQLAGKYGLPMPQTLSQRDVPGTTRSLIPILAAAGITTMSVGVNDAVPPPAMGGLPAAVWRDPASGTQILFLQHAGGYPDVPGVSPDLPGGLSRGDCVVIPGFAEALCWAFRTDNSGPPMSVSEVQGYWDILEGQFPGADIFASTYDNFTSRLLQRTDLLPVVAHEVGDTWIEGVPSDPVKMQQYREAGRALLDCIDAGGCNVSADSRLQHYARLLIKAPEHTWGLPGLNDNVNWTNTAFAAARAAGASNYGDCEAAWLEQRDFFVARGYDALQDHPLAADIQARLAALIPVRPNPTAAGYVAVPQSQWTAPMSCGGTSFGFDGATGGLATYTVGGVAFASPSHTLGSFAYRTYNDTDFSMTNSQYQYEYTCCFGQPGCAAAAHPQQMLVTGTMTDMWAAPAGGDGSVCSAIVRVVPPPLAVSYYGAPAEIWLNVSVGASGAASLGLTLMNKTATRLGETLWVAFNPAPLDGYTLQMDKLSILVDPLNVTVNGSQHSHAIDSGVLYTTQPRSESAYRDRVLGRDGSPAAASSLWISSLDVPIVSPVTAVDPATMLPAPMAPLTGPVTGAYFALFQNVYNTNYAFYALESAYYFRFGLEFVPAGAHGAAKAAGVGARAPAAMAQA